MYSDNITQKVAAVAAQILSGQKPVEEELKGNQKVLDKNNNNKLDSQDFKILRGEKKAIKEEDAYDKDRYAVKNGKAVKDNPAHMGSKDEPHHVWAKSADEALKKKMKEEIERVDEMDKSQTPPGRDGGEQFAPGPKVSKKTIKAVQKDPAKHLSDLLAKEYANKKIKEEGVAEGSINHSALGRHHEEMADQELRKVGSKLPDSWDAVKLRNKLASHPKYAQALKHYDKSEYHFGKAAKQGVKEEVEQIDEGIEDRLEAARAKAKAAGKPIKDKPAAPKSNVRKIEGSAYGGAKQKDEPEADEDDTPAKKTVKYGARQNYKRSTRVNESFTEMINSYKQEGLKFVADTLVVEEPTEEEFNAEIEKAKAKSQGKDKAEVAKASVQAVKNEQVEQEIQVIDADAANGVDEVTIDERHMTDAEMNKREKIVKSMKKGLSGFKQRYGDRAKNVMYATATKQAMKD
jgi:hypothetical protein